MIIEKIMSCMVKFTDTINGKAKRRNEAVAEIKRVYKSDVQREKLEVVENSFNNSLATWRKMTCEYIDTVIDSAEEYFRIKARVYEKPLIDFIVSAMSIDGLTTGDISIIREKVTESGSYWGSKVFINCMNELLKAETASDPVAYENRKEAAPDIDAYIAILEEIRNRCKAVVQEYAGDSVLNEDSPAKIAYIGYSRIEKFLAEKVIALNDVCPLFFNEIMFDGEVLDESEEEWIKNHKNRLETGNIFDYINHYHPEKRGTILRSIYRERYLKQSREDYVLELQAGNRDSDKSVHASMLVYELGTDELAHLASRGINIANYF